MQKEMQIHAFTIEGAAQTILLAVLPLWNAEEKGAREVQNSLKI